MNDNVKLERGDVLQRLDRLEALLGTTVPATGSLSQSWWVVSVALMATSVFFSYRSFGVPNHYYQIVMGALLVGLAYHRGSLVFPKPLGWLLAFLNFTFLSLALKLAIGGGTRLPFSFMKYPDLSIQPAPPKLISVLPNWTVTWQPTDLALWNFDLTVVQSFLVLLMVLAGAIGYQFFASLTAFLLLIVSIPALVDFDWNWVFPALVTGGLGIYLQKNIHRLSLGKT